MSRIVVDASVAIKWLIPEIHKEKASSLLNNAFELTAPDLLFAEIGNVLWKKVQRAELSNDEGRDLLADFTKIPLRLYRSQFLLDEAWTISAHFKRSFYDSLYLALARTHERRMVTADLKLYNALKHGPLKKMVLWVEDI